MVPSQMGEPHFIEDFFLVQEANMMLSACHNRDGDVDVANLSEGAPLVGVETHSRHAKSGF